MRKDLRGVGSIEEERTEEFGFLQRVCIRRRERSETTRRAATIGAKTFYSKKGTK